MCQTDNPCFGSATCEDGTFNFTCHCPDKYYGEHCEGKTFWFLCLGNHSTLEKINVCPNKAL